ncbi:MAG: lysine--tRNA ligase [Alphaproteobacteria bacterium]|nr:lysine--tRNA ligase [Alphaproteobacteria bacterium]
MTDQTDRAPAGEAWPFQEARKILARLAKRPKKEVFFETGYGPSGLPHIGTFGEVQRVSMVRQAFHDLAPDVPTRLVALSDDMDGLRKVPGNIPNQEMVAKHLGKPLTSIPDPFGKYESFGHHNNALLRDFLDRFGIEYEFRSSTDQYKRGVFDATLRKVLARHDEIAAIVLPTLGAERKETYSPILPISPKTGRVLQVPLLERKVDAGTVVFRDDDGTLTEVPVTGGHVKMQWKCDWAMRWAAFDVDFEMSGKDLIDSVKLSSQIVRVLGGEPPIAPIVELFLDEKGAKISKSRGNGLTIEEWLTYASTESLGMFMFHAPQRAKKLYFDVIPKNVDEYLGHLAAYREQATSDARKQNPVWFIHQGAPPVEDVPVTFGLLLNLVAAANTDDPKVLWGFVSRYAPEATPKDNPILDKLVGYAIRYYRDFVLPEKKHRSPTAQERAALEDLVHTLEALPAGADAEAIQNQVYEVGKRHGFANLRDWFKAMYETLCGQSQGPRMGSFIALYGVRETIALIRRALAGELAGRGA